MPSDISTNCNDLHIPWGKNALHLKVSHRSFLHEGHSYGKLIKRIFIGRKVLGTAEEIACACQRQRRSHHEI